MSSGAQPFGSNNPFRRKLGAASADSVVSSSFDPSFDPSLGIDGSPATPAATTQPPSTTFKSSVPENEKQDEEHPVQQKPKKIVKKVRVQSPPPSPPEDAIPVTRFPAPERLDSNDDSESASGSSIEDDGAEDPFNVVATDPDSKLNPEPALPQIPSNPFARTLQDIEGGGGVEDANAIGAATGASKASLDVDSFKRLLLTGYATLPTPPNPAPAPSESTRSHPGMAHGPGTLPDGASTTDTSSISKQSVFDAPQETPRTSHEISESEASEEHKGLLPSSPLAPIPSASARKKPPPPSSRHGKLIKIELGANSGSRPGTPAAAAAAAASRTAELGSPFGVVSPKASSESAATLHSPQGITNVNKPLPAPPLRPSAEEDVESPFDREAAGKVPEAFAEGQAQPKPPTSSPTTRSRSGSQTSTQSRKPAVPPPRRQGRSDSRAQSTHTVNADDDPPRSSMESSRSRTESLRAIVNPEKPSNAPAPPPPRRPGHARQGSSFVGVDRVSSAPTTSPGLSEMEQSPLGTGFTPLASPSIEHGSLHSPSATTMRPNGNTKISPPPPPPTRKQSVRRPLSVHGTIASNGQPPVRKSSREKDGNGPTPPPPPPRARGSYRQNSDLPAVGEEASQGSGLSSMSAVDGSATPPVAEIGNHGEEILADLNVLQREVDELMKKVAS